MKHILKYANLLFAAAIALASCNSKPEYYNPQSPADGMHVEASVEDLVLEKDKAAQNAVTLTWGAAYDHGADYTLSYFIRLRHGDMPSTYASDLVKVDNDVRSITYTVGEVNEMLAKWNVSPGDKISVEAQVLAVSDEGPVFQMPEISKTYFKVSGYDIANYLSMIIDRDGVETVTPISEEVVSTDKFLWTGKLNTGDKIRFVRSVADGTWPAYVKGSGVGTLALAGTETEGTDDMIEIVAYPGYQLPTNNDSYNIRVDMTGLTYEVGSNAILAAVGGATDIGWSNNDAVTRCLFKQPDPMNHPEIWTLTAHFKDGGEGDGRAFKILAENGWGKGFWAPAQGTDPFVISTLSTNGGGDNKWYMPAGANGTYTITINLVDMTLIMKE